MSFKSFVTETELAEIKQKRQEEWEKIRRPDQPLERPEEAYETRSLFEQLQANKAKKEEEFEDAHRYKNQIYGGMDDDEFKFVQELEQKVIEEEDKRWEEEGRQLQEFRAARSLPSDDVETGKKKLSKLKAQVGASKQRSQKQLLKGLVKRKGPGNEHQPEPVTKKPKAQAQDGAVKAATSAATAPVESTGNALLSLIGDYGSDDESD
eukprot:m.240786 g.240786  ORF g.240786 m.240786 type:complete len:208 (-) comp17442_c0_seq3:5213-5836(-)